MAHLSVDTLRCSTTRCEPAPVLARRHIRNYPIALKTPPHAHWAKSRRNYRRGRTAELVCASAQPAQGAASQQQRVASTTFASPPHVKAAIFTGSYAVAFGLALTFAPKTIFGLLFDANAVGSGWIRVGGILFTLIGWQYLGTALEDRQGKGPLGFYHATVWSRLALAAAFCLLVAMRESPGGLLVLAGINLVGAVSMHTALGRSAAAASSGASRSAAQAGSGGVVGGAGAGAAVGTRDSNTRSSSTGSGSGSSSSSGGAEDVSGGAPASSGEANGAGSGSRS